MLGRSGNDQLRHRLAAGRRIQDAPDAVPGGDEGVGDAEHWPEQGQAVLCDRPEAGLRGHDRGVGKSWCEDAGGLSGIPCVGHGLII